MKEEFPKTLKQQEVIVDDYSQFYECNMNNSDVIVIREKIISDVNYNYKFDLMSSNLYIRDLTSSNFELDSVTFYSYAIGNQYQYKSKKDIYIQDKENCISHLHRIILLDNGKIADNNELQNNDSIIIIKLKNKISDPKFLVKVTKTIGFYNNREKLMNKVIVPQIID